MGVVYEAFDERLQRRVAVKVLSPALARNPNVRSRFKTEALIQGGLTHPNIVRATDVLDEPGSLAIVMDFVDGPSLEEELTKRSKPMSLAEARVLLEPVLDALGAAHEHGIVHRDLKPGNILLDRVTGGRVPKVADFGIAKVVGSREGLTREGAVMGTPAYMPPEQLRGLLDLDHRADIYAIGAIVYRMLTAVMPFEGGTEYEVTHQVLSGERPPPPSSVVREISPAVDAWVMRAMAFDRDERFRTVRELRLALGEAAEGRAPAPPPATAPPTVFEAPEEPAAPVQRRSGPRWGLWIGAVLVVAIAGGAALYALNDGKRSRRSSNRDRDQGSQLDDERDEEELETEAPAPRRPTVDHAARPAAGGADEAMCQKAADKDTEAVWRAYLSLHPAGKCAQLARERLAARREKAGRATREQAARDQAARDKAARDQAARDQAARDQAARDAQRAQAAERARLAGRGGAQMAAARRHMAAINRCDLSAYQRTLAPTLRYWNKRGATAAWVAGKMRKTFQICKIRVYEMGMSLRPGGDGVRVWKKATVVGKPHKDFCICTQLQMAEYGGSWRINGIFDAPNVVDRSCSRRAELCP